MTEIEELKQEITELWLELTDETNRNTIDMIVRHVQKLEDKVDEIERHLQGKTPWIPADGEL